MKFFKHILLVFSFLTTTCFDLWSQETEEELKNKAEILFNEENFEAAFPIYSQLLSLNVENADYNYRFGTCQLLTSNNKEEGLKYLQFAAKKADAPAITHFYYGLGLQLNYRFDKALDEYQKYLDTGNKKDKEMALVSHHIQQCKNGKNLVSSFTDITVVQRQVLPRTDFYRNYDLSEFGGKIIIKPEDWMSEEDKKRDAKFLVYFQQDADYVYYSSYSDKNATGKDIYVIQKLPTGVWSTPTRLSEMINTGFDEDYPFIHPDGNVLYFASKGHNSMGGYDIFKSTRKGDGTWTQPINMEFAINTPWDDFLFISDKEENSAWFASNRETDTKQVTVYRIGIDRVPLDLTLIKGVFEAPGSRKAKITIEDLVQNKVIGVYESERQFGEYLLDIRGSGKYKFIVEAEESSAIHTGMVEVPRDKGLKQFRQEMKLVVNDGKEQLQIINHFDEPLTESLLTAEVLKKQATLLVNANEADLAKTTELLEPSAQPSVTSGLNKTEGLQMAKKELSELKAESKLLDQKAAFLFAKAEALPYNDNPESLAEAALAVELASIYQREAEQRETAVKQIDAAINLAENGQLDDAASVTQINRALATSVNFKSEDAIDEIIENNFDKRMEPMADLYLSKKEELFNLESDITGIDEEIEYYRKEIENSKDPVIKEDLSAQIEAAKKQKPEKEAAASRAKLELEAATEQKTNAEGYLSLTKTLITSADLGAPKVTTTVNSTALNQLQTSLNTLAASNPALVAFVVPESADDALNQELAEARKTETKEAPAPTSPARYITAQSPGETIIRLEEGTVSLDDPKNQNVGEPNLASAQPANELQIVVDQENETTTITQPVATTTQPEVNETQPTENSAMADLNAEIRAIEASPTQTEKVNGNYNEIFSTQIAEVSKAEDPIIAETRKAEIYDQWADNLKFRIDSIETKQLSETNTDVKLAQEKELRVLNEQRTEKAALAMASYETIAKLSDEQAAKPESSIVTSSTQPATNTAVQTNTAQGSNENTAATTTETPINSTAIIESVDAIGEAKSNEIASLASISDPIERTKAEIKLNDEWADTLQSKLVLLSQLIAQASDDDEKTQLENKASELSTLRLEKQNRASQLAKQISENERSDVYAKNNQTLQNQILPYLESYSSAAFVQLQNQIAQSTDPQLKAEQMKILNQSWVLAIQNQERRTESRLTNTDDPNQKADLQEKLVELTSEKLYVQARLDSISGGTASVENGKPSATVISGSEKYEGYQPVSSPKPAEYEAKAESKQAETSKHESELANLQTKLTETKNKKEIALIQSEIDQKTAEIKLNEMEVRFYSQSATLISGIEPQLLQLEEGDPTPAQVQQNIAATLQTEADTKTQQAATMSTDALAVKKKKEREAAVINAKRAENDALLKRTEAQLAVELASEMTLIENQAIAQNFIIPNGNLVVMPTIARTLNPNEQTDVAATSEFTAYNKTKSKADSLRRESQKLQAAEALIQNESQQILTQSYSANNADRTRLTQDAYVQYERADSLSKMAARLNRQAAYILNEANRELLKQPEEVYQNILAYYNSVPATQASEPTSAEIAALVNVANPVQPATETSTQITPAETTPQEEVSPTTVAAIEPTVQPNLPATPNPVVQQKPASFDLTPPEENSQKVQIRPDVISNTIFELDKTQTKSTYSSNNPIPINPPLPEGVVYKVQIGAFSKQIQQDAFRGIKPIVGESAGNGLTRYFAGQFRDFTSADFAQDEIREISPSYKDAFVVAFYNGKRITIAEARALENPALRPNQRTGPAPDPNFVITSTTRPANRIVQQGDLKIQDIENQRGVFFTVQVGVYRRVVTGAEIYNITPLNQETLPDGRYRYTTGIYSDENLAIQARDEIRTLGPGVRDAFVTAYRSGKRVTVDEARISLSTANSQPATSTESATEAVTAEIYTVRLGIYTGEIPVNEAAVILRLSSNNIEKISNTDGSNVYYYGSYKTEAEAAAEAAKIQADGLSQATAIKR